MSAKISATCFSVAVPGAALSGPAVTCAARTSGRAERSTFRAVVSGSSPRTSHALGIMYAGSWLQMTPEPRRGRLLSVCRYNVTDQFRPAARVCLHRHDGRPHEGMRQERRLDLSSSIRSPLTFTWLSRRPRNSRCRPAVHRTRSPVRYTRAPGCTGSATNRSAVSSGWFR